MGTNATIIRAAGQTRSWTLTQLMTPLLGREHTDDHLSIAHMEVAKGTGSPPHMHTREDEAFYVLEGELTLLYGDRLVTAGPGAFVWGPRNVPHNFQGSSEKPAKALLLVTPAAGFAGFSAGFVHPLTDPDAWPPLTGFEIDTLLRQAPDYGIEMFPPTYAMPTTVTTAAGASKQMWVMGEHVSYLATSEQTGGTLTVVEIRTAPSGGPPPHAHGKEDEIVYVIDGRHEVMLGDRTETAGPGDLVWIPRGTRHRYSNIEATPGKILSLHTPGGFEKFFDDAGVDATHHRTAPRMAPPSPEAVMALLEKHGMTG